MGTRKPTDEPTFAPVPLAAQKLGLPEDFLLELIGAGAVPGLQREDGEFFICLEKARLELARLAGKERFF